MPAPFWPGRCTCGAHLVQGICPVDRSVRDPEPMGRVVLGVAVLVAVLVIVAAWLGWRT